jgi:Zn-finger protein
VYLEQGIKDCSGCNIPHTEAGYQHVFSKLRMVSELAKNNRNYTLSLESESKK